MRIGKRYLLGLAVCALVSHGPISAPGADYLAKGDYLNGEKTLESLTAAFESVRESLVTIGFSSKFGSPISVGVVVSDDGLILTKASEYVDTADVRVYTADGKAHRSQVVKEDSAHDLVLLRIPMRGLKPIHWGTSDEVTLGNWIASVSGGPEGVRLGAISANRRAIARSGGAMGVMLGEEFADGSVLIEAVAPRGSANDAGLKDGDLIKVVDGKKAAGSASLIDLVKSKNPGDRLQVQVLRKGKKLEFDVVLRSRSALYSNWDEDPMMGGKASKRIDDFPEVIQHDTPLNASSMGGLLLDLDGHVVGMNIARIDRVTTFALPSEIVGKVVARLMAAAPKLVAPPASEEVARRAHGRSRHYR